jgi:hypothetical protein
VGVLALARGTAAASAHAATRHRRPGRITDRLRRAEA